MGQFTGNETVGQIVVERPRASRVLGKLGIDFCCGGKRPLSDVCHERGLVLDEVLAQLEKDVPRSARSCWVDAPLSDLVSHIVERHHTFTRAELERLGPMLEKVARVHGERHPEMIEVAALFRGFAADLMLHMQKEEVVLFPAIRQLVENERPTSIAAPITCMRSEHERAGSELAQMRSLTHGYAAPSGACNTFRAVLEGLAELEADVHEHVHLENNVLFERALSCVR
ncbi:MAG: iron-sulfur cluster repair di-iron protein [Deltaproteobacteria bacterium]|nr:iron-sulfur cluster repair di-iron protein [Deltaproteobacteria bacterium]